jgi:hypothetical protein
MVIVLSGNQQIYMVDLAGQKYIFKYIFFSGWLCYHTKDSDLWLDGGGPPQNTFANI